MYNKHLDRLARRLPPQSIVCLTFKFGISHNFREEQFPSRNPWGLLKLCSTGIWMWNPSWNWVLMNSWTCSYCTGLLVVQRYLCWATKPHYLVGGGRNEVYGSWALQSPLGGTKLWSVEEFTSNMVNQVTESPKHTRSYILDLVFILRQLRHDMDVEILPSIRCLTNYSLITFHLTGATFPCREDLLL